MPLPIPRGASAAYDQHKNNSPQNPSLLFDRYTPELNDTDKELKRRALQEIVEAARKTDPALSREWNARWETTVKVAHAEPFEAATDWRFVTGLGRKGPLEVGFTFHRYGFPMLPGSSVKGVARAYARAVLGMQHPEDNDAPPDFTAVFGKAPEGKGDTGAQAGRAIFFDAIPKSRPGLVLDIMNPHYPDYYQNGKAPTNWQSPKPVPFLTVKEGTTFRFAVGWRGVADEEAKRLQALTVKWLQGGLSELGAGAKTSAGYGYFTVKAVPVSIGGGSGTDAPPPPPPPTKTAKGKISNKEGKAYVIDEADPNLRLRLDWKALGMNALGDKVPVTYEYEELPEGKRRITSIVKRFGG